MSRRISLLLLAVICVLLGVSKRLSELQPSLTNSLLTLTTVNRLYGQRGYDFRPEYLKLLEDNWQASFESVDFIHHASSIITQINSWVQNQTHDRIKSLIPAGALDEYSRLVVLNAIYLKAPWLNSFSAEYTRPGHFHLSDGAVIQVPTMSQSNPENFSPLGLGAGSGPDRQVTCSVLPPSSPSDTLGGWP